MRTTTSICLLSAALAANACSRSSSSNPDAHAVADAAPGSPDAPPGTPDAPSFDATPDGTVSTAQTRVWVEGDFITNGVNQVGMFVAEGSTPPLSLTGFPSAGELASDTAFAVSPDGTKLAYAADSVTAATYDLYISNADGSSPMMVMAGAAAKNLTNITWSPDGSKLAFRWDGVTTGQFEMYVVAAAASSTPTRVSPDRANTALDAVGQVDWSSDSKYLAFTGDFTVDGEVELWTADTSVSPPTTVKLIGDADINAAAAPKGVIQPGPKFTAGGKLLVDAVLDAANDRHIYVCDPITPGATVLASTAMNRTDASPAEGHMFALSPDRTKIVFAADGLIATAFETYLGNADGTGTPARLTDGTIRAGGEPDRFDDMVWSPDAMHVAFSADYGTTDEKYEPWVVDVAGGAHRVAVIGGAAAQDSSKVAWTKAGTQLYFIADSATDNIFQLDVADPTMTDRTPTLVVDVPGSGDVSNLVSFPMP